MATNQLQVNTCKNCGEQFVVNLTEFQLMGIPDLPEWCPRCCDEAQGRPDVTLARGEIYATTCLVASLPPGQWQRVERDGDKGAWKLSIKGSQYGSSWSGRIDIYAVTLLAPATGEIVRISEMEVLKKVSVKREQRVRSDFRAGTNVDYEKVLHVPLGTEGAEDAQEIRRYVRLDPCTDDPQGRQLVYCTAWHKTTLKGLGRQVYGSLNGTPLWKKEVSGGVRSGREHTTGWLAVVDRDHPVLWRGNGDETYYPAEAANVAADQILG